MDPVKKFSRTRASREEMVRNIRLRFATETVRGERFDYFADPAIQVISNVFLKNYIERGLVLDGIKMASKLPADIKTIPQSITYTVYLLNDIRRKDEVKVSLGSVS